MKTFSMLVAYAIAMGGCSNGGGDADAGAGGLGVSPAVPQACQTCLTQSSSNDCATQKKNCTGDSVCVSLNSCIDKCPNVDQSCVQNCSAAASQNAIGEWNAWAQCGCSDCNSQCGATFCSIGSTNDSGTGDSGTGDSGNTADSGGSCIADDQACSSSVACCTFCASDNYCGCIASGSPCYLDSDCCSDICDQSMCQ